MSHPHPTATLRPEALRIPSGSLWHRLPVLGAAAGAVGLVVSIGFGLADPRQFYFSWLVSFLFFLSIALGGLFVVLVLYVTWAGWGVTIRRLAENAMGTLPFFAVLLLPVLLGMHDLFHWTHEDAVAHDPLLQSKRPYLNTGFFLVRAVVYFTVWTLLARYFSRLSERQDETGDPEISRRLRAAAAPGLLAFALTLTFAAVDWMMSLDPHWYSTMFGVYYFAGTALAILSFLVIAAASLHRAGLAREAITVEHIHDLGKLLFGFTVFWAYIGFSQYFLIWYANIPEETSWYFHRLSGSWFGVGVFLALGHFVLPFFFFMPRAVKRNVGLMVAGSAWVLFVHFVDIYWCVMPTLHEHGLHVSILDFSTFLAVGGFFLAAFAWLVRGRAVVPLRDPRLPEALAFENL